MGEAADASRGRSGIKESAELILSVACIIAALAAAVLLAANLLAEYLPDELERDYLSLPVKAVLSDAEEDRPAPPRAVNIFYKVLGAACRQAPCRRLHYRLRYMEYDEQPNAFAAPGGDVYVTAGLLQQVKTEAGLAFVLAHEIAHHNRRHILKHFWHDVLWRGLLGMGGLEPGGLALNFSKLGYSRAAEKEADLYALRAVYPLYGDKEEEYLEFFLRLRDSPPPLAERSEWLSTHPDIQGRIEYLRAELAVLSAAAAGGKKSAR